VSGPATPAGAAPQHEERERNADLRLARLHLRGGSHALARAELEALAGRDGLDRDAILDLAEVRWRTGDLAGASVAAAAWLEDGEDGGPPGALAHVICAEAAATRGAADAAAGHVEAAAPGLGDWAALDAILAGIAARAAWPWEPAPPVPALAAAPAPSASRPAPEPASTPSVPGPPADELPPAASLVSGAPVVPAAAELARAGAALVGTAPERASVLLALALRADRAAAEAVLDALDALDAPDALDARDPAAPPPPHAAALAFVRAEALRAAGRHDEARIAYASAERLALAPAEAGTPRSSQ
jgi:hypothetical protein